MLRHFISQVAEFDVRRECPRLLNLVYYASKARHRLELLSQLGHPASGVSINVLSMAASDFARVFYSGSDRGRPRETAEYLAHLLRKPEAEVRKMRGRLERGWLCTLDWFCFALQVNSCPAYACSRRGVTAVLTAPSCTPRAETCYICAKIACFMLHMHQDANIAVCQRKKTVSI